MRESGPILDCAEQLRSKLCETAETPKERELIERTMFLVTTLLLDVHRIANALQTIAENGNNTLA